MKIISCFIHSINFLNYLYSLKINIKTSFSKNLNINLCEYNSDCILPQVCCFFNDFSKEKYGYCCEKPYKLIYIPTK